MEEGAPRRVDRAGAQTAAGLLALAGIELVPMRALLPEATRWAVMLAHPAYDCMYLALAAERGVPFVTADDALIRKLGVFGRSAGIPSVVALVAAAGLAGP